ncbi:MAG: energy-coupling factor transporter transmembrane component T [Syntrophomonas sp.]|nr:energy-coupling factor transporter transmembrane component T [Syntrophomonas sp.]
MIDQFFYTEKGNFMQTLHPAASLTYIAVLLVLVLAFSHPLYLIGLMLSVVLAIWAAEGLKAWEGYMKLALGMAVLIMIINPLASSTGNTVLWLTPDLPGLGVLAITVESIFYGALMGLRLLIIVSIFCLYNQIIHPDRLLNLWPRFFRKSALVVSLATRLFPVMTASLHRIKEVQQLRGVDFQAGTLRQRWGKYLYMFNILLISSLEDSLEMAEAMQARAFGSGPRLRYRRDYFRPRDMLCLISCLLAAGIALYALFDGLGTYSFYSGWGDMPGGSSNLPIMAAILGGLSLPALLSWGAQHCHYLESRI